MTPRTVVIGWLAILAAVLGVAALGCSKQVPANVGGSELFCFAGAAAGEDIITCADTPATCEAKRAAFDGDTVGECKAAIVAIGALK